MIPHTNRFSTGRRFHKQSHVKSRNGCSSCKDRRVKCDEIHPRCSNCQRRGEKCEYIAPGPIFKKRRKQSRTYVIPYSADTDDQSADSSPSSLSSETPGPHSGLAGLAGLCGMVTKTIDDTFGLSENLLLDPSLINEFHHHLGASHLSHLDENRLTLKSALVPRPVASSYMDHSILNSKLFAFYESTFITRISKFPIVLQYWVGLTARANSFPYVYHISMAVAAISLFYDAIAANEENRKEGVLMLDSPLMYKELASQHFNQFLKCYDIESAAKSKNVVKIFTYMAASTLQILFHVMSPCGSVCDPLFYKSSRAGSILYEESMPFIALDENTVDDDDFNCVCDEAKLSNQVRVKKSVVKKAETCLDLSYYTTHSTPVVTQNTWLFFPNYLYAIADQQPFENGKKYPQNKVGPDYLKHSIDILKKEYLLVYNNQQPEKDSIRVLLRWPALVPEKFYNALGVQDQRCLIVVAHFIMLLASLNFDVLLPKVKLVGEVSNIYSVLDDHWKPWVHLPMRCLGIL